MSLFSGSINCTECKTEDTAPANICANCVRNLQEHILNKVDALASSYPEHDKLTLVRDQSQKCGEFLEWLLGPQHYTLAEYHTHGKFCVDEGEKICGMSTTTLYPAGISVRKLLADFFEIDEAKLEAEKLAMLAKMQEGQR